ncbi:ATPase-like protein, partial [mine drainage metagenome]
DAMIGDANSQNTVRTFMRRMLGKLARETNSAVLLLAHIDKAGVRKGTAGQSFIGSVAWHNSARSRLALTEVPGAMELRHEKSNLGRRIPAIRLGFDASGVLMPVSGPTEAQAADATGRHADALLGVIRAALAQASEIVLARTGTATTQRQLDTMPTFPPELRGTAGRLQFWTAIDSLLQDGRLQAAPFTNSRRKNRVRLTVPEVGSCALEPLRSSPIPPANGALE